MYDLAQDWKRIRSQFLWGLGQAWHNIRSTAQAINTYSDNFRGPSGAHTGISHPRRECVQCSLK